MNTLDPRYLNDPSKILSDLAEVDDLPPEGKEAVIGLFYLSWTVLARTPQSADAAAMLLQCLHQLGHEDLIQLITEQAAIAKNKPPTTVTLHKDDLKKIVVGR